MSEYWIQDASAATQNILLMATELGLGACWNGVHPQVNVVERIKKILELDENVIPLSLIHIGYMDEEKSPNLGYDENRVFFVK
jgi:nitroreductase